MGANTDNTNALDALINAAAAIRPKSPIRTSGTGPPATVPAKAPHPLLAKKEELGPVKAELQEHANEEDPLMGIAAKAAAEKMERMAKAKKAAAEAAEKAAKTMMKVKEEVVSTEKTTEQEAPAVEPPTIPTKEELAESGGLKGTASTSSVRASIAPKASPRPNAAPTVAAVAGASIAGGVKTELEPITKMEVASSNANASKGSGAIAKAASKTKFSSSELLSKRVDDLR